VKTPGNNWANMKFGFGGRRRRRWTLWRFCAMWYDGEGCGVQLFDRLEQGGAFSLHLGVVSGKYGSYTVNLPFLDGGCAGAI